MAATTGPMQAAGDPTQSHFRMLAEWQALLTSCRTPPECLSALWTHQPVHYILLERKLKDLSQSVLGATQLHDWHIAIICQCTTRT